MLEAETSLSHDRLARLYREIRGCSPPKGMLPFSVDWFMTWLPNIHSSLFYNVYSFLNARTTSKGIRAVIDAYRLYLENSGVDNAESGEPVLSFTRAWMLVRFFDGGMLQLSACRQCGGHFIAHAHDPQSDFVCAICRRRAGRRAAASAPAAALCLPPTPPVPDRRRPNHQKPWKTPRNPPFWVGEQGIIDAGFRLRWQGPDVLIVIGYLVVSVSVVGSFIALGGHLGALYQPFELTLIFGAPSARSWPATARSP